MQFKIIDTFRPFKTALQFLKITPENAMPQINLKMKQHENEIPS